MRLSLRWRFDLRGTGFPLSRERTEGGRAVPVSANGDEIAPASPLSGQLLVPGPAVPLDQCDGGGRAPASGRIGARHFWPARPRLEDRFDPAPGRLHLVAAHEKSGVATYRIHQQ